MSRWEDQNITWLQNSNWAISNFIKIAFNVSAGVALVKLYKCIQIAQQVKFSVKDFFSKYEQIRRSF